MNQNYKVVFLSNFLDDTTRLNRHIETDSPACSRKILMMALALAEFDQKLPLILSMGRGRQLDGKTTFHKGSTASINGVDVIYAAFLTGRFFSELISVISVCCNLFKLRMLYPSTSFKLVAWNRTNAYLLPLVISKLLLFQNYLDIEDQDYFPSNRRFVNFFVKARITIYDLLCDSGRLLSTQYLVDPRYPNKQSVYYGYLDSEFFSKTSKILPRFNQDSPIHFLFCGTLTADTGADTLLRCLDMMRNLRTRFCHPIVFHICGYGPFIPLFRDFGLSGSFPEVTVHGRLPTKKFSDLLVKIDVSLALKKVSGPLSRTTFPSKVLELAGSGHHIITTDVSDIKKVLGVDSVSYLYDDNPESLLFLILDCIDNIENVKFRAIQKASHLRKSFSIQSSQKLLVNFFDIK